MGPIHPNPHIFGTVGGNRSHPEETHADTGVRMCRLHTDSDPSRESNPCPRRCEAAVGIWNVLPGKVVETKSLRTSKVKKNYLLVTSSLTFTLQ